MISVSLNSIAKPNDNTADATSNPLSFLDWYNKNRGISFVDANTQYKKYIESFYHTTTKNKEDAVSKIRNDYVGLIKKLSILFKDDLDFARYSSIDFDSEEDIKIAIPKYAEKLKRIAMFYMAKREELKHKKLEYNLVGSEGGLNNILYNKLAGSFTNNDKISFNNENPLITISPTFSAIREDFSIEIQELYSTTDPFYNTVNINPFVCIFNDTCSSLSDTPLSGLTDPLLNILCETGTGRIESTLQAAYNKYIGTDINYLSGGFFREYIKTIDIPFTQGNNSFYWFSGGTVFDIPEGVFKDVPINSIDWSATGASSPEDADTLFVSVGNILNEGAWLQDTDYISTSGDMRCVINDGKIFKFPFCDYGTSAIGGIWSGPSISEPLSRVEEFYPSEDDFVKSHDQVYDMYWNTFSSISTVVGINIQDCTLGKYTGFSSNDYQNADKIIISTPSSNRQSNNDYVTGWLFKFNQTQLPITIGKNNILFPILTYNDPSELFFSYSSGASIVLSSLDIGDCFCGAVAGETIAESDMIIKNATVCGPETEAAWLRSPALKQFKTNSSSDCSCVNSTKSFSTEWEFISGGAQIGTSFKCNPGEYIRFTWTGESININDVKGFTGFKHDDACPYKSQKHDVSIVDKNFLDDNNRSLFEKWKLCTCQAVNFSPFGHRETYLDQFKIIPDFIVKDTGFPNSFNKSIWKGSDGNSYTNSSDCARFIPNIIEKDLGWGDGVWRTTKGSESFILEKGYSYIYYRSITNNCSFESPYFVINHKHTPIQFKNNICYNTSNIPIWVKAIKNSDGEWEDTGEISDMVLNFGDFITYDHKTEISEEREKMLYDGIDISSVSGSNVVLEIDDSKISYIRTTTQVPSINFLIKIPLHDNLPYWGEYVGSRSQIVNDYLHVYQPKPLNKVLNQYNVLEYKFGCDSECFIWEQPLQFSTYHPIKQWNKILIDPYINSDILSYLNSEKQGCVVPVQQCSTDCNINFYSECYQRCLTNKSGMTATNDKSELIFNTELSGIPVFISLVANTDFIQSINITDISKGLSSEFVPVVSGVLIDAQYPWRNLLNGDRSVFVVEETEELLDANQLGFYTPSMVSMNRWETFGNEYVINNPSGSLQTFSYDNYVGGVIDIKEPKSDHIISNSFGNSDGDIISKYQQFAPYNSIFTNEILGLYEDGMIFSPWDKYSWPENSKEFKKDYTGCLDNWYTSQLMLTGDVYQWEGDIFGNNFFLVMDNISNYTSPPSTYGDIFIKKTNKDVCNMFECLSAVFDKYQNITFQTPTEYTYLTTEDGLYLVTEDGEYIIL